MGVYLRGKYYIVQYELNGVLVKFSTKQGNKKKAEQAEARDRSERLEGRMGIVDKEREEAKIPTLAEFMEKYLPEAKKKLKISSYNRWAIPQCSVLRKYPLLAEKKISKITAQDASDFVTYRLGLGLKPASANAGLRCLSAILTYAEESKAITIRPNFKGLLAPGEECRERVVSVQEEACYLRAAPELLRSVATIMVDTGLRPEEVHRLEWQNIQWNVGLYGQLSTRKGKSKAAERTLPMSGRVRALLEMRFTAAGEPARGWVFPGRGKTGHIAESAVRTQHERAFKNLEKEGQPVERFVLYSLRHTFLTRLADCNPDPWRFKKLAGHSKIEMSLKYVHPDEASTLRVMEDFNNRMEAERERKGLNFSPVVEKSTKILPDTETLNDKIVN